MSNDKQYQVNNNISLHLYVNDFVKYCTNKNCKMLGFIIGQDGGKLHFTYWYDHNKERQNIALDIDFKDIDLDILLQHFDIEYLQNEFLNVANQYGGVKEFLQFQPNFRKYKQAINNRL